MGSAAKGFLAFAACRASVPYSPGANRSTLRHIGTQAMIQWLGYFFIFLVYKYHSKALYKLLDTADKLTGFDTRLFRKTVEKIKVQPTGKLTFFFKAGIKTTA